ncbi:MAG TPA: organomercurial lyase [Planctomycetota bacterium]
MAAVIPNTTDAVRGLIMRDFVALAAAPTVAKLAHELELSEAMVVACLRQLHDEKRLELDKDRRSVLLAMPFSTHGSTVRIVARGLTWFAPCIFDAFGVAHLLGEDCEIHAFCPDCEEDQVVRVHDGEVREVDGVVHFPLPARTWWADDITLSCRRIHLFHSDQHVERWCQNTGTPRGKSIEVERQALLSREWYAGRLDPAWRWPGTVAFQATLAGVGLVGPFWELLG